METSTPPAPPSIERHIPRHALQAARKRAGRVLLLLTGSDEPQTIKDIAAALHWTPMRVYLHLEALRAVRLVEQIDRWTWALSDSPAGQRYRRARNQEAEAFWERVHRLREARAAERTPPAIQPPALVDTHRTEGSGWADEMIAPGITRAPTVKRCTVLRDAPTAPRATGSRPLSEKGTSP